MFGRQNKAFSIGRARFIFATLLLLVGSMGLAFGQPNPFLQQLSTPTQSLNDQQNVRYKRTPPSAAVVIRTGFVGQNGQTVELCKLNPGVHIVLVPDTPYFAAMIDADLHGQTFVDPDRQRGGMTFYGAVDFVAMGSCDADGLVRLNGLPALPWIISAKLPQKIPGTDGNRIIIHTNLLPNATNTITFSQKDIVSPSDTVSAGFGFNLPAVRDAFARLPTLTDEAAAAQQSLAAIDRGDLYGAAVATLHYLDACVKATKCSDSLKLSMQQEFASNRPWFEFFGALATGGIAEELLAGKAVAAATTEEEIGLRNIGLAFRKNAVAVTGDSASGARLGQIVGTYDAVNTGPLQESFAVTFSGGRYNVVILKKDTILYRAGAATKPMGDFFVTRPPQGIIQSRIDSAVLPRWPNGAISPIDSVISVRIPAGTKIYAGSASAQGSLYVGGTEQIVIPGAQAGVIPGIEVISVSPLK